MGGSTRTSTTPSSCGRGISVATSSTDYVPIRHLSIDTLITKGAVSAGVNGTFSGGPVDLRVTGIGVFEPGPVSFDASTGEPPFSFTFVATTKEATCHPVSVEWRSPTGAKIKLVSGDLVLDYRKVPENGGGSQFCL